MQSMNAHRPVSLNKAQAYVHFHRKGRNRPYAGHRADARFGRLFRLIGTRGSVSFPAFPFLAIRLRLPGLRRRPERPFQRLIPALGRFFFG